MNVKSIKGIDDLQMDIYTGNNRNVLTFLSFAKKIKILFFLFLFAIFFFFTNRYKIYT